MNTDIGTDEFDSILELIIIVMFFSFSLFATNYMLDKLTIRADAHLLSDKVTTRIDITDLENPYQMTGYGAYMTAWIMSGDVDTKLGFVNDNAVSLDADDANYVLITTRTDTGARRSNFSSYLSRLVTGRNGAMEEKRSVKKVFKSFTTTRPISVQDVYKSMLFTLELTDGYVFDEEVVTNDFGNVVERKKVHIWTMLPEAIP